jgi:hypothetical protein
MTDYLLRDNSNTIYAFKYLSELEDVNQNDIIFYKVRIFNPREHHNSPVLETIINNKLKVKYDYKQKK